MPETVAIIVGAGPTGLSAAACLNQLSIPNVLLERDDCIASLWKKKTYDRLHLHLAKKFCELPHMSFPTTFPKYVTRNQFIQYLDDYASHFKISPMYQRLVECASYDEVTKTWKVQARNIAVNSIEEYSGRFLVVATGETCDAFIPEVDGLGTFKGEVIHSTQYKSGKNYSDKHVLVVGCGNSGMEIAFDLSNYGAKTSIVIRNPLQIFSREMMDVAVALAKYIPINILDYLVVLMSKLMYGDLSKYGIRRPQHGPFFLKANHGKFPVMDVGTCKKIKSREIQVLPGITRITGNDICFEDGKSHPFDAIVFATGFERPTNKWLKGEKISKLWKGENGLYWAGFGGRGFFRAGMDAQNIANDIKSLL
ncbi:probable indole-3-pyruvate monooxygenase YUCCA10 [Cornus florida]|uniref:probable indole-3-pyruvate monooxygenase YUCCA10 n=1 Tax=Cornus florida TaxID=4283 RepID=UPI002896746D|nr:probable indole-3-pyruvate monooxygenase YUCCA10 [Cornus florida]